MKFRPNLFDVLCTPKEIFLTLLEPKKLTLLSNVDKSSGEPFFYRPINVLGAMRKMLESVIYN